MHNAKIIFNENITNKTKMVIFEYEYMYINSRAIFLLDVDCDIEYMEKDLKDDSISVYAFIRNMQYHYNRSAYIQIKHYLGLLGDYDGRLLDPFTNKEIEWKLEESWDSLINIVKFHVRSQQYL